MARKSFYFIVFLLCCFHITDAQGIQKLRDLDLPTFTSLFDSLDTSPRVITFWASWCAPCMEELPYFSELKKNKPEIRVVMVNLDFNQEVHRKVLPLLAKYKDCEVVRIPGLNADDWMPIVDADWSGAVPATSFIQGSERIFVDTKFNSYSELHQIVQSKN